MISCSSIAIAFIIRRSAWWHPAGPRLVHHPILAPTLLRTYFMCMPMHNSLYMISVVYSPNWNDLAIDQSKTRKLLPLLALLVSGRTPNIILRNYDGYNMMNTKVVVGRQCRGRQTKDTKMLRKSAFILLLTPA